jgi:hypothetical protein
MNRRTIQVLVIVAMVLVFAFSSGEAKANEAKKSGLLGARYGGSDFEGLDREPRIIINSVDKDWTHGSEDYSCRWYGYIVGPFTGKVNFAAEADNGLILKIDDKVVIDGKDKKGSGLFSMVKGKSYPVEFSFFTSGYPAYFRLYWSWNGQVKEIVDPSALYHTVENERFIMHEVMDCKWWENDAPFQFTGKSAEALNFSYQDGGLPPVVGVHNYQVFRANKEHPEYAYGRSNTYHHQPFIAYWNGKIYVEFVSSPKNENQAPQPAVLAVSETGRYWSTPQVIFPAFRLHDGSGRTVAHHRMGFYVSSNNRLLVSSFYDLDDSAQDGLGVGRVVREVYKDGTLSPIYFIRYNRHKGSPGKKWDESNTPYPLYTASKDAGFVAICRELLSNKLYRQQWWEEERSTDGFYTIAADGEFSCEAFDWYTRADGKIVGLWKHGYASISTDGGNSWAEPKKIPSIITAGAKTWGQKTNDGRYAMAFNPHVEWRYPLAVITSDDGYTFSDMACIHGEVPDQRYKGSTRELGPQYVRGISEGNGEPPEDAMWLVYSLSKEDIWVSRVPLPISTTVSEWVDDTFDNLIPSGGVVNNWNIYSGQWIPVEVVNYPTVVDKSLKLSDMDPWDYARAVRVFPKTDKARVKFDLLAMQPKNARMEVEVTGRRGERPVRIELTEDSRLKAADGDKIVELSTYKAETWLSFEVRVDAAKGEYSVSLNNKEVLKKAGFAEKVDSVERLSFRTGKYRKHGLKTRQLGQEVNDEPVGEVEYYVNNVSIAR